MAYTPTVPQASQTISETQSIISANFTDIKTQNDVNHVTFDITDAGKHKFLQMPVQGSAPTTGASELGVYTKNDAAGVLRLFLREISNGAERQISGPVLSSASGYAPLIGGLLLQWGVNTGTWTGATITFPVAFTANPYSITANAVFANTSTREFVQITTIASSTAWTPRLVQDGGGDVSGARTLYWMAIGPHT